MANIKIKKFTAKPVEVEAVQITAENIEEVAKWCGGQVRTESIGDDTQKYIKAKVYRALNDKQTKGYIGDWLLKRGTSFKVYTDKAFKNGYTDGGSVPLSLTSEMEDVQPALFNGMLEELRQMQEVRARGESLTNQIAAQEHKETHLAVSGHETVFVTPSSGMPSSEIAEQEKFVRFQKATDDLPAGTYATEIPGERLIVT